MDVKLRALFSLQLCKYLTTKMNPLNLLIIKSTQCYTIYSSPYYYRNLLLEHVGAVEQLFVVYLLCVVRCRWSHRPQLAVQLCLLTGSQGSAALVTYKLSSTTILFPPSLRLPFFYKLFSSTGCQPAKEPYKLT